MENNDIDTRIAILEHTANTHQTEISRLFEATNNLDTALEAIQMQLAQIKWIVVGAACYAMATETGILGLVKAVL